MATQKEKKTVEAKAPGKEQKVKSGAAAKEQKPKVEKPEMVNIFSTTYGYYRYFVKVILAEGGISKFRFVKDAESYNGKIAVAKEEVDKSKKVLAEYQKKNPDTVVMWK